MLPDHIQVTENPEQAINDLFRVFDHHYTAVLVDENTYHHCYPLIKAYLPPHTLIYISSGEKHKNLTTCADIWKHLTEAGFDRKALLINLGGGVIGDMGGFCAAAYKRGIAFCNIPTTLLAQVDASVGGKLGIDFEGYKNHIGFFQEPYRVIIYPEFIKTLPERELRSGFAEVIKHGLIADSTYWEQIANADIHDQPWADRIKKSVEIKNEVVQQDPKEQGLRKILNYGHTIGHAVESFFMNADNPLLHGEAIAIGMICEAWLSTKYAGLPTQALEEINNYLGRIYSYVDIKETDFNVIAKLAVQDKKNEKGVINASLLNNIGTAGINYSISAKDIIDSLEFYKNLKVDGNTGQPLNS